MIDQFESKINEATPAPEHYTAPPNEYTAWMYDFPMKHRKPKGKKATKRALKKAERERDQLLYANGRLTLENEMLKRTFVLSVAAKRRQLNDGLVEDATRLLPPHRKNGDR